MKSNAIRALIICTLLAVIELCSCTAQSQECQVLRTGESDQLLSYLKAVKLNGENAECVTLVIQKLGTERYRAAIDTLAQMLDFRRPPMGREKQGLYLHPQGIWEIYPAAGALAMIGKDSMPALLTVMKAQSSPIKARENAVFVWMQLHKYESAMGISLLVQEQTKTNEPSTMQRLRWAVQKAEEWCNPVDQAECQRAARRIP
jgi:hypothetical protein